MRDSRDFLTRLKDWFMDSNSKSQMNKKHYILILLVLGIAFMLFASLMSKSPSPSSQPVNANIDNQEDVEAFGNTQKSQPNSMIEYERYYENQLKDALETIVGVEEVAIVVNVESTEKKEYEKNVIHHRQTTDETDANGGKRKVEDISTEEQMVTIREGDKEIPLVSTTWKPKIQGVLVVAKGADNIQVKKWIIEAVTRVLDVPSHRVSVQAKK